MCGTSHMLYKVERIQDRNETLGITISLSVNMKIKISNKHKRLGSQNTLFQESSKFLKEQRNAEAVCWRRRRAIDINEPQVKIANGLQKNLNSLKAPEISKLYFRNFELSPDQQTSKPELLTDQQTRVNNSDSTLPCFINSEWISLSGLFGFHNRSCDNTLRKSFCEISFSVL